MLWHDGPPDPAKLDALIALGREHLRSDTPEAGPREGHGLRVHVASPRRPTAGRRACGPEQCNGLDRRRSSTADIEVHACPRRPARPGRAPQPPAADRRPPRSRTAYARRSATANWSCSTNPRSTCDAVRCWPSRRCCAGITPVLGRLEPHAFIPIAERSDLIKVLGTWVIERALTDLAAWQDDRITMRINVSPAQIASDDVVRRLERALADHGVPGKQVCIEFTETDGSIDDTELAGTLPGLARLGGQHRPRRPRDRLQHVEPVAFAPGRCDQDRP